MQGRSLVLGFRHQQATTRAPATPSVPVARHILSDSPHGIPATFNGPMSCLCAVYCLRDWVCASETSYAHQHRYCLLFYSYIVSELAKKILLNQAFS